jgi:hypothetical protein
MTIDANEARRIRREQETSKWQEGVAETLEHIHDVLREICRNTAFLVPEGEREPETMPIGSGGGADT